MTEPEGPAPKEETLPATDKASQTSDSITEVHFDLTEPRKSVSFKCNEKLWKAFVSKIKREGGSVCHILEPIVLALLTAKVHLSNTMQPVVIQHLHVQRVVQRHRRVYHESEYVDVVQDVVHLGEPGVCHECGSRSYVHPRITVNNQRVFLCRSCASGWIKKGFIPVLKG